MRGQTHAILGGAVGLGTDLVHPLVVQLGFPELPATVTHLAGAGVGAAALFALGSFIGRLPDVDLRIGLPHRGPTHSFVAAAIVAFGVFAVVAAFTPVFAIELAVLTAVAYLSHLAADLVNPTPMALLWPYPERIRPRWLPAARESSIIGWVVEMVTITCVAALFAWQLHDRI